MKTDSSNRRGGFCSSPEKGWIRNADEGYHNHKTVNMRNAFLSSDAMERLRQQVRTAIHRTVRRTMGEMERRWEQRETAVAAASGPGA